MRGYGASATAKGTIEPSARPVRYALAGHVDGVDVRRLPKQLRLPPLESRLAGDYTVAGAGSRLDASATFDASTIEGTEVRDGATGRFNNLDGTLHYGFTGHVTHADMQRWGRVLDLAVDQRRRLRRPASPGSSPWTARDRRSTRSSSTPPRSSSPRRRLP